MRKLRKPDIGLTKEQALLGELIHLILPQVENQSVYPVEVSQKANSNSNQKSVVDVLHNLLIPFVTVVRGTVAGNDHTPVHHRLSFSLNSLW